MDLGEYVAERRQALFRFAVVLTGDPVLAEDVLADALARAAERWPQVAAADNVHAYVRRMVLNEYLGWRRRAARLTVRADVADLLPPADDPAVAHAEHAALAARGRWSRAQLGAIADTAVITGHPDDPDRWYDARTLP